MIVRIGLSSCGIAAGGLPVKEALALVIEQQGLDWELQQTGCIGMCHYEPLVDVIHEDGSINTYGNVTVDGAREIVAAEASGTALEKYRIATDREPNDCLAGQVRIALRNCGTIDPESIQDYINSGGYQALQKALNQMTPKQVIEEIKISGLKGRGGAGFPTWFKWNATRQEPGDIKYLICNADEGDPGAFMDRSLLEGDPHSVLEGMVIAGYAIGAATGIVYARAEYPLAIKRLGKAIEQAQAHGILGSNIMGSDFSFDISIKQGAGAFVCGEETALIASLEGERGMPRLKPPFPSQRGYWDKPSNINNVETLANVPWIIANGGASFAAMGTEDSKGTKVFALAGRIKRGGLVEVPMGMTLREIIWARRWNQGRQEVQGGPIGRTFRGLHTRSPAGHPGGLPIHKKHRCHYGLRGHGGNGRNHMHGGSSPLLFKFYPGRILRQMCTLPDRHQAHAGDHGTVVCRRRQTGGHRSAGNAGTANNGRLPVRTGQQRPKSGVDYH